MAESNSVGVSLGSKPAYKHPLILYQVPLTETHVGDSRIGFFVIQDGNRMEVCHGIPSFSSRRFRRGDAFDTRFGNRQIDRLIFDLCEKAWEARSPHSDQKNQGHRYLPSVVARQSGFKVKEVEAAMIAHIDAGNLRPGQQAKSRGQKGLKVVRRPENAAATFD